MTTHYLDGVLFFTIKINGTDCIYLEISCFSIAAECDPNHQVNDLFFGAYLS